MTLEELEARMRPHEAVSERATPGVMMVARLEGRGFARLLARRPELEGALDVRVRDVMIATADHLMNCGPSSDYGHVQGDEISLLFAGEEVRRGRPLHEYVAVLAGEASAKCTLLLGELASFRCRISELPGTERVVDYFRWRQAEGERQAVAAHCRWILREREKLEHSAGAAGEDPLAGSSIDEQRGLLRHAGVDWERVPDWQRRGVGLYWTSITPRPSAPDPTVRRRIRVEFELPAGDDYAEFVRALAQPDGG